MTARPFRPGPGALTTSTGLASYRRWPYRTNADHRLCLCRGTAARHPRSPLAATAASSRLRALLPGWYLCYQRADGHWYPACRQLASCPYPRGCADGELCLVTPLLQPCGLARVRASVREAAAPVWDCGWPGNHPRVPASPGAGEVMIGPPAAPQPTAPIRSSSSRRPVSRSSWHLSRRTTRSAIGAGNTVREIDLAADVGPQRSSTRSPTAGTMAARAMSASGTAGIVASSSAMRAVTCSTRRQAVPCPWPAHRA
jgi:hypothetical protein